MVRAGDTFDNPVSGQRLIFLKTARDTGGLLLEVESIYMKPSPSHPPVHYHPSQEERFKVLYGEVYALIDGEQRKLKEGETLLIPRGIPHSMWAQEAGTHVNWQTRPALKSEAFFETLWGLAKDGKTNDKGVPNLLQAAVIAQHYEQEYRLVSPPRLAQKVLFGSLAQVGRLLGYEEARYSYPYGGPYEALGAANERSLVALRARIGVVLMVLTIGLLVPYLLRRWRHVIHDILTPL